MGPNEDEFDPDFFDDRDDFDDFDEDDEDYWEDDF